MNAEICSVNKLKRIKVVVRSILCHLKAHHQLQKMVLTQHLQAFRGSRMKPASFTVRVLLPVTQTLHFYSSRSSGPAKVHSLF